MIYLADGVSLVGLNWRMREVIQYAEHVWGTHGQDLVVTETLGAGSFEGGPHSAWSLHGYGCAVDLRTNYFDRRTIEVIADKMRVRFGAPFDIVVHQTHMHIEWDYRKDPNVVVP